MTPTHYATDINTTVNMWDITTRMWKPLINIATNWNMTTPHASRPTVGNLNMTIMLLRSRIGMSSATAISTPDGINRMLTSTWRIGNMPATTITLAAPTSANGPRRLTVQALDTEMLSADVVTSGCVPVTLIAEMCLPHTARITNMNTNIPLTRILRIVPLIDNLLPRSVPELDIRLTGSSATWTINRQASMWTVTSTATINGPQLTEPLNIESTTIISPTSCSNRMTMNKWVETWTMTFVPTTMAVTMDLSVTTPMLINHMRVDSPGLLRLNNLVLRLKTLGELGRIVPVDIDLEWQKQGATWNLQLRSLHVDLASVVKLNVSIILDDTRYFVHWNIGSPRFPLWNQIVEVDLRQNSRSSDWLCSSAISNLFFWMRMNSTVSSGVIGPIMTTIGFPDSPNGLTIQWEAAQRKWILSFTDDALYRCEGIPQTSNPDQYQFTCWRAQPRQGKAPSRTTQVASWVGPNLLTPTTWVQWVPQILSFNWNKLLNQQWIANELNTICHITEPALSTRIARYISMESEKLMKKLNTDLNLEDALQMMTYMQYIPYYQPVANGVGGWNRWLKQLIGADLQTGIKTGSNWIAFQCNVTCSSCSAPVAMELRMRLDENNQPIVNTTITNSAMAIYATWTTSIPPRIVHTSVQMLNRPGHMDTHTTYSNTGPTTITADIVPANMDRVRCVGHTNNAMSMLHFVCNKMQGDTVGPVITTFDLPTNWWQIFIATTQAYMNPVSQPLSDDLYQLVEATRSFITIFDPVDAPVQSDQLQQTLKSSYNFMMAAVPYNSWDVSQMLVGIIYPAMGPEGMRIPVWRTTNPLVDMTFFVDIGTEIGISMDTSSELPLMTGTMGINLMSKNNIPMLGMISNNNLWKSTTQYNIRTMKLEGSTVVLPDITNDIKIIPVFATTGQMSGLKSNFADGEGTNYQCIATMGDPINVVCYKLEPRTPVCSFPMLTNSPIYDTMSTLWMIVPAVYTAALQPVVFKS
uniref:Uncharacterized protein n=1 Tax=Ciona savignyi TaxID=51511 RepID=H2YIH7_CIOSA